MPAQSRAQRRKMNARAQQRPSITTGQPRIYSSDEAPATVVAEASDVVAAPVVMPTPATNSRVASRLRTRPTPAPVDYAKEYRDIARDLRLIALWAGLLFLAMFALYFAQSNGWF